MKKSAILILVLATASAALAESAASPVFEPGKETRLDAGKPAGEILVYVPTDYNDDCNWPTIYFYHGMGGQLSTKWLQIATEGKGYIIVSLEFIESHNEKLNHTQYRVYIEKEIKNFGYVRHFVQEKLKTDSKKTVLAGISRGGWLVADMFTARPQLAAATVITAAGHHLWLADTSSSMTGKYVYIGAGETDQNRASAEMAARFFNSRNADVMLEIYPGLAHQIDPNAPKLQRWLSELSGKLNQPKIDKPRLKGPNEPNASKPLSADF